MRQKPKGKGVPAPSGKQKGPAADQVSFGLAWYTAEEWERLRDIADDPDQFENTYAEWLAEANKTAASFKKQGIQVQPVDVSVEELAAWLRARGQKNTRSTRAGFVAHKLHQLNERARAGDQWASPDATPWSEWLDE